MKVHSAGWNPFSVVLSNAKILKAKQTAEQWPDISAETILYDSKYDLCNRIDKMLDHFFYGDAKEKALTLIIDIANLEQDSKYAKKTELDKYLVDAKSKYEELREMLPDYWKHRVCPSVKFTDSVLIIGIYSPPKTTPDDTIKFSFETALFGNDLDKGQIENEEEEIILELGLDPELAQEEAAQYELRVDPAMFKNMEQASILAAEDSVAAWEELYALMKYWQLSSACNNQQQIDDYLKLAVEHYVNFRKMLPTDLQTVICPTTIDDIQNQIAESAGFMLVINVNSTGDIGRTEFPFLTYSAQLSEEDDDTNNELDHSVEPLSSKEAQIIEDTPAFLKEVEKRWIS